MIRADCQSSISREMHFPLASMAIFISFVLDGSNIFSPFFPFSEEKKRRRGKEREREKHLGNISNFGEDLINYSNKSKSGGIYKTFIIASIF